MGFEFRRERDNEISVAEGEVVEIVIEGKYWTVVRNAKGEEGWVSTHYLGEEISDVDDDDLAGLTVSFIPSILFPLIFAFLSFEYFRCYGICRVYGIHANR